MGSPTSSPEEWRPVVGYEGLYEVSNLGRVRSVPRTATQIGRYGELQVRLHKGRLLKPVLEERPLGYIRPKVSLCRGKRNQRPYRIHQLVAAAFLGPAPTNTEIAHFDGDPTNNRADNLRYATKIENAADRDRHGTTPRGERVGSAKLSPSEVLEIRRRKGAEPQTVTADAFGVSQIQISRIQRGERWRHL